MHPPVHRVPSTPLAVAILVAAVLLVSAAPAHAGNRWDKTEDRVAGGTHWRIRTDKGPIHVWVPDSYDRSSAGLIVYIHGYRVDVDEAWKRQRLPQQFAKSRQNAMFVAIEAPSSNDEAVVWDALGDVKKAILDANFILPDGPPVVVAHSGGFRTVEHWVDNRLLSQVILLDANYGGEAAFREFIGTGKRAKYHKMTIIASDTATKAKAFVRKFPFALARDDFPDEYSGFTHNQRRAKLLYIRSQYGHSEIVRGGHVLPLALRLSPLERM